MSRHARLLATILALAPAAAHADPTHEPAKLAIFAGPGVRLLHDTTNLIDEPPVRMFPSLAATVAYRGWTHFALGIHANTTRYSLAYYYGSENDKYSVISVDLAIAMQYERDRFTVTPWFGRNLSRVANRYTVCEPGFPNRCPSGGRTDWESRFTSYGLTASFLPVRSIPIVVFLLLQAGIGPSTGYDMRESATFGLAYQR